MQSAPQNDPPPVTRPALLPHVAVESPGMRAAATICFVLAGLSTLGGLNALAKPPAEPQSESFWIGHYIGLAGGPLIFLSLGIGLRRIANRREAKRATTPSDPIDERSTTDPAPKWSVLGGVLTALFLIGTVAALPREGENWYALNIAGVLVGACLTFRAAYMTVRRSKART